MPNLPATTKAAMIAAMLRFDEELRGQGRWATWPTRADKFALSYRDQRYPVKHIISMATGAKVSTFSGGNESNRYAAKLGLIVIGL